MGHKTRPIQATPGEIARAQLVAAAIKLVRAQYPESSDEAARATAGTWLTSAGRDLLEATARR